MSSVIVFIIIAMVLYTIFKPKNKPERTGDPTVPCPQQQFLERHDPPQSFPPRRKGWLESLEDMMDAGRWDPYRREESPQSRTQRTQAPPRPSAQGETFVEQRMRERAKEQKYGQGFTEKPAMDDRFASYKKAASTTLDPKPPPVMYKKAADGTLLRMEHASIVQGFIWSQVLGDPACKRPPGAYRRGGGIP